MYQPPAYQHLPRKRLLWPWFASIAALVVIAGAFVFAFWVTSGDEPPGDSSGASGEPFELSSPEPPLRAAFDGCHSGDLSDADRTLVIDTQGEDYGSDTFDGLMCTLGELGTPQSVIARMEQTRALDGMQDARWDDFDASWTYHPDAGLDLIITEVS